MACEQPLGQQDLHPLADELLAPLAEQRLRRRVENHDHAGAVDAMIVCIAAVIAVERRGDDRPRASPSWMSYRPVVL